MTEEQYQQARHLRGEIFTHKEALTNLDEVQNHLCLPQEMWDRHIAEKRAFLCSELARLEKAFAAL